MLHTIYVDFFLKKLKAKKEKRKKGKDKQGKFGCGCKK